jgi:hypothetical protein
MVDNSVVVRLVVKDDGSVELKRFAGQVAAAKAETEGLRTSGLSLGGVFDALDGKLGNLGTQFGSLNTRIAGMSSTMRHDLLYTIRDVTAGLFAMAGAADYFGLRAVNSVTHTMAAFSTLTGGMRQAHQLFAQVQQLNLHSPFSAQPLNAAEQTLLGFGFGPAASLNVLRSISNVASVQQDPNEALTRMALAVGQINQSGTVRAQDLNQLVQSGLPAYALVPGGRAGLLSGHGTMNSAQFMAALTDPNSAVMGRYANAAQAQNQTLSGQLSNLSSRLFMTSSHAFAPMGGELQHMIPGLTRELRGDVRTLAPDMSALGLDVVKGAQALLPVMVPLVHALAGGVDKLLGAGGPFLRELQAVDPQVTGALGRLFDTLAAEEPQIASIFGDLVQVLPLFIGDLNDLLMLSDPLLKVLDTLLGFGPAKHVMADLLVVLLAYKSLSGPIGVVLEMTKVIKGMTTAENANTTAILRNREVQNMPRLPPGTPPGTPSEGGGGLFGNLFKGLAVATGVQYVGSAVWHELQGRASTQDKITSALSTPGLPFIAPFVLPRVGKWLGLQDHNPAVPPAAAGMTPYAARLSAVQNDPRLQRLLARSGGSVNVQTGAITVHAAPGMDEAKLAAAIRVELDAWIVQQQQRQ